MSHRSTHYAGVANYKNLGTAKAFTSNGTATSNELVAGRTDAYTFYILANHAGTMTVQRTVNNSTWTTIATSGTISASTQGSLSVYDNSGVRLRCVFTNNDSNAGTVDIWVALRDSAEDSHTASRSGAYFASSGRQAVLASAHAATVGFMWLINPVGSVKLMAVRSAIGQAFPVAATAFTSAPTITCERTTFTGTASGTTITAALRDSTDAAATGSLRTASTGLSLSAGAVVGAMVVPPVITAVGITQAVPQMLIPVTSADDRVVLRAGEGLIFRQTDNGTASDTRIAVIELCWEEYIA